ncbi:hypothetical protein HHI36_013852 [Cryptolaemus montrouzieri]|uniref:Uncharacterized protein n=1 Tax=Cryptolaemus montrouzieri TaxID=559131 RepID=A0ABD2N254_9CUCU
MLTKFIVISLFFLINALLVESCLITNCPTGGKRSGKLSRIDIRACVSCGPGRTGQCFGPGICCGPFGCLMGTSETVRCQKEGFFHDNEPCIAGNSSCRRNTGRCASEGICCNQDSCHTDSSCSSEDKLRNSISESLFPLDIYNVLAYQSEDANK